MDPLSLTTFTSPAIVSNQTQQTQQNQQTEQTRPLSRSRPTSLPLPTRNQAQLTTPDGPPKPKELPPDLPVNGRIQTKDTTALVPDKDKSTIKYATQAALNGDPLTASDLSRVRQVNHAMNETHENIKVSSNISRDIRQTNGESVFTTEVGSAYANADNSARQAEGQAITSMARLGKRSAEEVGEDPKLKSLTETINTSRAAFAETAGGGNCGARAYATTRHLAGKKLPGDTIETVSSGIKGVDHAFNTVTPPKDSHDSKLIADSWMIGPGHREEDGLNVHKGPKLSIETYSSEDDKLKLLQNYNEKVGNINAEQNYHVNNRTGKSMKEIIQNNIQKNKVILPSDPGVIEKGQPKEGKFNGLYNEAQSLSPEFRDGARSAAIEAGRLEGPRQLGKALVTTTDIYEGPLREGELQPRSKFPEEHVNDMIPVLAKELGIPLEEADAIDNLANHVSGVVRREAMKSESVPLTNEYDKWVNKS
jgi:hypothetical protein